MFPSMFPVTDRFPGIVNRFNDPFYAITFGKLEPSRNGGSLSFWALRAGATATVAGEAYRVSFTYIDGTISGGGLVIDLAEDERLASCEK